MVASLIPDSSRVLDLGCGDGALLAHLRDASGCTVRGVELSREGIAACVGAGIPCVQADLDEGLAALPDGSFDVVVLSQTLQVVRHPDKVVREMVRVGRRCIVSFPNFAHWRVRAYLALRGRMPVSEAIPYAWYDTPNIHHATIKDFRELCAAAGASIEREIPLVTGADGLAHGVRFLPNLRADTAVAVVEKM